ncbi:MAG: hypothetical protein AAF613_09270 [Pseudomonadota bacterium]
MVLTAGFGLVMRHWQFELIDTLSDPAEIRDHIAVLTQVQKQVHIWVTATMDVAYPFAYTALFVGMALRYFGRFGPWLSIPIAMALPADLVEGFIQILALMGQDQLVGWKAWLTPLKFALAYFGLVIAFIGLCIAIFRSLRGRST